MADMREPPESRDVQDAGAEVQPRRIRLEASSRCQLRCPSCPTTTKAAYPVIGSGWLSFTHFRALVDANPWLEEIELSNYGEMFLNPEILQIMEYAHDRGVTLTCDNGSNFNFVREDVLQGLVRFRFRSVTCSIDGATQATYGAYRVGGDYHRVIANIRRLNEYKERDRSELPYLTWQFVVFGHNEHELPLARQLAHDLGMAFYGKLSWDSEVSAIRNEGAVRRHLGLEAATRAEYRDVHGTGYLDDVCGQLWDAPQINWDGKVLGCCRNYWGEFGGDALTGGLLPSINSEAMRVARRMLLGREAARPGIPCTACPVYMDRQRTGDWMVRDARGRHDAS